MKNTFQRTGRKTGSTLATALWLAFLILAAHDARAVPACPVPITVQQPDGITIQIYLRGDEFLHWNEDSAGFTILKEEQTGRWVYAVRDSEGSLVPSSSVVGRDNPQLLGVPRRLLAASAKAQSRAARADLQQAAVAGQAGLTLAPRTGTMRNLVICVEFPDLRATNTWDGDFWLLFNDSGYPDDGAQGCVNDYINEVSYNQLNVESVVTGWIMLTNNYAYYGRHDENGNIDAHPREMVEEALAHLKASGFNFSDLDANGDGWVDSLTVVHAGGGEEYSGNNPSYIWSHQWSMTRTITYDGVSMREYCTVPERRGYDVTPMTWGITRIGVICHEMGHLLGLPDLYDTNYDSAGAGDFCVMAHGCWGGAQGTAPPHMCAWCKKKLGWLMPVLPSAAGVYHVPSVENQPFACELHGSFPPNEYFLVENRQGYGFDASVPGSSRGLLIWHIDEAQTNNNDHTHYMVDLEEASGTQDMELGLDYGDNFDYFRADNNKVFASATTPNNRSYSGKPLGPDICMVSASGPVMTFYLMPLVSAWGDDHYGQMDVPADLTSVVAIAAGGYHNLVLKNDGKVVAWGDNSYGQTDVPPELANVVAIAGGGWHSLALKAGGTVVAWGANDYGETDVPATLTNAVAIAAGGYHSLALKADGTVVIWGFLTYVPPGLTNVVAIAGGGEHSLALKSDGTVVAWGDNTYHQCDVPPELANVVAIAGGIAHSLALKSDGTVVGWGTGPGLANAPQNLTNAVAIAAGQYHSLALKADGTLVAWGVGFGASDPSLFGLANVRAIGAGYVHNLALKGDDSPFITVPPYSKTVNAGESVSFQVVAGGAGTLSYQWKKGGIDLPGEHSRTLTIAGVFSANKGSYTVVVTNAAGRATSSPAVLTVIDPFITTQPASRTNIAGTTATFSASVIATAPAYEHWLKDGVVLTNGGKVSGATTATLIVSSVTQSDAASYTFVVTNVGGSATSLPATLTIWDPPLINTQPTNRTNLAGTTATFAVSASGTPPLSYQWIKNGTNYLADTNNVSGTTTNTLTLTNVATGDAASYTIIITNAAGSVTSSPAILTVVKPPVITTQPASRTNVAGTMATFTVGASGTSPLSYQWRFNGFDIAAATTDTCAVLNVQFTNAGPYAVVITNAYGAVTSQVATLTVNCPNIVGPYSPDTYTLHLWHLDESNAPAVDAVATAPLDLNVLTNGATLGNSSFQGFGTALSTYDGGPNGINLTNLDASLSPLPLPNAYTALSYADPVTGAFTYEAIVRIDFDPAESLGAVTNGGNGRNSAMQIMTAEGNTNGARLFQFRLDPAGVAASNSAPLLEFINVNRGSSPQSITASIPTTGSNAMASNQWYHVAVTYNGSPATSNNLKLYWTVLGSSPTNANLIGSGSMLLNLPAGLAPNFVIGNTGRAPLGNTNNPFQNNFVGLIDEVRMSSIARSSGDMQFQPIAPVLLSQPASQNVDVGALVNFAVSAAGVPPLNYQWHKGGTNLVGRTAATLTLTNVGRRDSGVYAVLVTNVYGSVLSSNATLVVRVPQRLGTPMLLPDGACVIISGDEDDGLLSTNDLPNFEVYAGTNLVDWVLLTNDLTLTNGQLWLYDTARTNYPLRFYRILEH